MHSPVLQFCMQIRSLLIGSVLVVAEWPVSDTSTYRTEVERSITCGTLKYKQKIAINVILIAEQNPPDFDCPPVR